MKTEPPNWPLGYLASVSTGSFFFIAYSFAQEYFDPPPGTQLPEAVPVPLLAIMGWLIFAFPMSLVLAAVPFAIGYWIARHFRLRGPLFYVSAGGVCGRFIYFVFPFGIHGQLASWIAGTVGGLAFWASAIRRSQWQ